MSTPKVIADPNGEKTFEDQAKEKQEAGSEQGQPDTGDDYWKNQALQWREQYSKLAQYKNIIGALEENPDLVSMIEKKIVGEVSDGADDNGSDIWGVDDETPAKANARSRAVTPDEHARAVREAEERGAKLAAERQKMQAMFDRLISQGVPDHMIDKFTALLNDPNAWAVEDFWAAFEYRENRMNKKSDAPADEKNKEAAPAPIAAVPGGHDRPGSKELKDPNAGGWNYVANANEI